MDYLPKDMFLELPPSTLKDVRADINMDKPGEMNDAVRILDEWIQRQPHFKAKNIFSHHYLEMTIVMAKGSIERAKRIIDNMCTARTLMPQYFEPHDPRENYEKFKNKVFLIATPVLTLDYCRMIIFKINGKLHNELLEPIFKYIYTCLDYLKANDYHSGVNLVLDVTDADLTYFTTKTNIFKIRSCFLVFLDSYGMRLKKGHVITSSHLAHFVASFFKQTLSQKLKERILVNQRVEDLQKYYPKEVLPKDYGGYCKTILELQESVTNVISTDKHIQYMKTMYEAQIDKALRPLCQFDENAGLCGTFRSLNID